MFDAASAAVSAETMFEPASTELPAPPKTAML
jgi:hypothetical protein